MYDREMRASVSGDSLSAMSHGYNGGGGSGSASGAGGAASLGVGTALGSSFDGGMAGDSGAVRTYADHLARRAKMRETRRNR